MMRFSPRRTLFALLFMLSLVGVIIGWLVVLNRLVRNDAEIARTKVREAEERYLVEAISEYNRTNPDAVGLFPEKMILGGFRAGVWSPSFDLHFSGEDFVEPVKKPWPGDDSVGDSRALMERRAEFSWGYVEDGRDRLGSLLLKFARKEEKDFAATPILKEGVWNYEGSRTPMSPGFRLLMITELETREPSDELARLKLAERIRAVEGDVSQLDVPLQEIKSNGLSIFYTKEQLLQLFGGKDLELTSQTPVGRVSVQVPEFDQWPYLSLKSGFNGESLAVTRSRDAIWWVSIATLFLTGVVILAAIWLGRNELRRARSRTDLASSVAHELRTPLAGQRIVLENLQDRTGDLPQQDRESLSMALRENERLGDLAESFLTFSRLERGVLKVERHPVNLANVVGEVVERFSSQWSDEDLIEIDLDPLMPPVLGDESGVGTVARNLIENAFKYSVTPRQISIKQIELENEVGLSVSDNGQGLSEKERALIFKQFYRVDQSMSRPRDGLGLGLSIVKRLVEGMGGRIFVESTPGKGTTFRVLFEKGEKS